MAAGALSGTGPVVPVITAQFSAVASSLGGVIADLRQARLMLDASRDLHQATDLLIVALKEEGRAAAWTDLLVDLNKEKATLVETAASSGLFSAASVLKPLFQEIAPGVELVANPPAGDIPILRAAAAASVHQRSKIESESIPASYHAAIGALEELSKQHGKLENDHPLDIASILAGVDRLQTVLKKLPN